MSKVVLVQASPLNASTGAVVPVRLAGGGTFAYSQLGFRDWRAGVSSDPRFTTALGFDDSGWTGGAVPQTGAITFNSADQTLLTQLAALVWKGCRITVTTGNDTDPAPIYTTRLVGTVAAVATNDGVLTLTVSDLSGDLNKPVCPDSFAGTGDLEGGTDATGRVKRRTWGRGWNIEGRILDPANLVFEFGDPNRQWQSIDLVKDKGNAYASQTVVAWQGTALATLQALRTTTVASGAVAVAPSIACAKPWTQPSGPITADVKGEIGTGYVETVAAMAAAIVAVYSTITVANTAAAVTWRPAPAGIHCQDTSETVGNVLDRLLLPSSLLWSLSGAGQLSFLQQTWTGPVETIVSQQVERETIYSPLRTRKVGYQLNNRIHTAGEISAALTAANVEGLTDWATFPRPTTVVSRLQDSGRGTDGRLLNSSNNYGLRALSTTPGMSATVVSGSVTVSFDATGTLYSDWGATIALPSASFPGLAFSTKYYFWRIMPTPDTVGTGYGYSTSITDALGTGKVYLGFYTTPASGGGGGGGGGYGNDNCVWSEAWIASDRCETRGADLQSGDAMRLLSADFTRSVSGRCEASAVQRNGCVTLFSKRGIRLTLALNTPVPTASGGWVIAANATGYRVATEDRRWWRFAWLFGSRFQWERIVRVVYVGQRTVAKVSCRNGTYAAGDQRGCYIYSHNALPTKP